MKFAIIIPQGRYKRSPELTAHCAQYMHDLQASLDYPHVLFSADGVDMYSGKTAVLNAAIQLLKPETFDVWCTFDDDIWLPKGWMHQMARAFAVYPEYVAFGVDWAHTDEGAAYMMEVNEPVEREGVRVRPLNRQNIAGAMLCARGNVIKQVGINPNNAKIKYDLSEDGWRCGQYRRYGKIGYVILDGEKPRLLHTPDSVEYNTQKILESRAIGHRHPLENYMKV